MFKAIYLTGTIVAFCFALLWLDVDEMREEMREEERGYYREKPHGKEHIVQAYFLFHGRSSFPTSCFALLFCHSAPRILPTRAGMEVIKQWNRALSLNSRYTMGR